MEKLIVSIKVIPAAMFVGEYYVGESSSVTNDEIVLKNPVRFVEAMIPQQIKSNQLDATGKPLVQTALVPNTQSIEEAGVSHSEIGVRKARIVATSVINKQTNSGLLEAYEEALKIRAANKAGLHLTDATGKIRQ